MNKLYRQKPLRKERQMAYDQYLKDCNKKSIKPRDQFLSFINSTSLIYDLDDFTPKTNKQELRIECNIISTYSYWHKIIIYGQNPISSTHINTKKRSKTPYNTLSIQDESKQSNRCLLMNSISTNISISSTLTHLEISLLKLTHSLCKTLSKCISINKSITFVKITNCSFDSLQPSTELLFALSNNSYIVRCDIVYCALNDSSSHSIAQMISCHTHYNQGTKWETNLRRDSIRDSLPFYLSGLQIVNLSNNCLASTAAKAISQALVNDNYIHSIDMTSNYFNETDCGLFIIMLRTNTALINCDLRYNQGYSFRTHARIAFKLCRNIKRIKEEFLNRNITQDEYDALRAFANIELFQINTLNHLRNSGNGNGNGNDITFAQKTNMTSIDFNGIKQMRRGLSLSGDNFNDSHNHNNSGLNDKRVNKQLVVLANENVKLKKEIRMLYQRCNSNSYIKTNNNEKVRNKNNSFSMTMSNTEYNNDKEKEKEHRSNKVKIKKLKNVIKDLNHLLFSLTQDQ